MKRTNFTLSTVVLFCGCSSGPALLSELRSVILNINTDRGFSVSLSASGCPELGTGATATLDGAPMVLVTSGGTAPGLSPVLPSCGAPTFELTELNHDGGVSQLVISDESATFAAQVSSPRTTRPLRLEGGDAGTLQPGARATLVWPYENESLHRQRTTLSLLPADAGLSVLVQSDELEFSGSAVSFTVPALPPGPVKVSLRSSSLQLSSCDGPSSCILHSGVGELAATVVP